jgi:hypothetical protein
MTRMMVGRRYCNSLPLGETHAQAAVRAQLRSWERIEVTGVFSSLLKKRARNRWPRAPRELRQRLVAAGGMSGCCLLHCCRMRYRSRLTGRGSSGRDRLFGGARTQAKHDSRCSKKGKCFHSLNSFVEDSAQVTWADVFLAKFFLCYATGTSRPSSLEA